MKVLEPYGKSSQISSARVVKSKGSSNSSKQITSLHSQSSISNNIYNNSTARVQENACCVFCEKFRQQQKFSKMVGRALYQKYSASQNYYYSKDVNEILTNQRTSVVIRLKDLSTFDDTEEFLNRLYLHHEYDGKIRRLSEYYKFHRDIARLFMLPSTTTLNKYHDKKRRLYYIQVTRMLKERETAAAAAANGGVVPPAKAIHEKKEDDGDNSPTKGQHDSSSIYKGGIELERVLAPLELEESVGSHQYSLQQQNSHTMHDLNNKLNDILMNSTRSTQSYFFDHEVSQSIGNLSNFLNHLRAGDTSSQMQQTLDLSIQNININNLPSQQQLRPINSNLQKFIGKNAFIKKLSGVAAVPESSAFKNSGDSGVQLLQNSNQNTTSNAQLHQIASDPKPQILSKNIARTASNQHIKGPDRIPPFSLQNTEQLLHKSNGSTSPPVKRKISRNERDFVEQFAAKPTQSLSSQSSLSNLRLRSDAFIAQQSERIAKRGSVNVNTQQQPLHKVIAAEGQIPLAKSSSENFTHEIASNKPSADPSPCSALIKTNGSKNQAKLLQSQITAKKINTFVNTAEQAAHSPQTNTAPAGMSSTGYGSLGTFTQQVSHIENQKNPNIPQQRQVSPQMKRSGGGGGGESGSNTALLKASLSKENELKYQQITLRPSAQQHLQNSQKPLIEQMNLNAQLWLQRGGSSTNQMQGRSTSENHKQLPSASSLKYQQQMSQEDNTAHSARPSSITGSQESIALAHLQKKASGFMSSGAAGQDNNNSNKLRFSNNDHTEQQQQMLLEQKAGSEVGSQSRLRSSVDLIEQQNAAAQLQKKGGVGSATGNVPSKKSLSTYRFDNLGELKQFYKEVQQRTSNDKHIKIQSNPSTMGAAQLGSHRGKHNYFAKGEVSTAVSKSSLTARLVQNSQDQSTSSKEVSPRIKRIQPQQEQGPPRSSENIGGMMNNHNSSITKLKVSSSGSSSMQDRDALTSRRITGQISITKIPSSFHSTQPYQGGNSTRDTHSSSAALKKLQYKQQASKNGSETSSARITQSNVDYNKPSSSSTQLVPSHNSSAVNIFSSSQQQQSSSQQSSQPQQSGGFSSAYSTFVGSFTAAAAASQQSLQANQNPPTSSRKVLDKISHTRINSMNAVLSSQKTSQILPNSQQQQQQHQQQLPESIGGNSTEIKKKKGYHKYNKSEADSVTSLLQAQGLSNNNNNFSGQTLPQQLGMNSGSLSTQPSLSKFQVVKSVAQVPVANSGHLQSAIQSYQKGVTKQQGSLSPVRTFYQQQQLGHSDYQQQQQQQQQFFTYANNNIVNIFVNNQDNGTILQANNLINTQNQLVHQNINAQQIHMSKPRNSNASQKFQR